MSIVDADRIWFKSHHGLDVDQIDRESGLCASAILHDGPWLVNDARVDARTLAETFEWEDSDTEHQDLVEPQREELAKSTGSWTASPDLIQTIRSEMRSGSSPQRLGGLFPPSAEVTTSDEVGRVLFDGFAHEHHVALLQQELSGGSRGVEELASCVFKEVDDERIRLATLVALVDICVAAQPSSNNAPLLPARYHFLLRSLEGAFVCRHPDHPLSAPRLRLSRHESCPFCTDAGVEARMFEYGTCRKCGTGFAVGSQDESSEDVLHLGSAPLYGDNLVCLAFAPPRAAVMTRTRPPLRGTRKLLRSAFSNTSALAAGQCQPYGVGTRHRTGDRPWRRSRSVTPPGVITARRTRSPTRKVRHVPPGAGSAFRSPVDVPDRPPSPS